MVIGNIGENCTGKSTLAAEIQKRQGGEIVTGKDYLRLAKSESMAAALFRKKLKEALTGDAVLYVISEQDQAKLLPEGLSASWSKRISRPSRSVLKPACGGICPRRWL